jgi:hypothetical protein
MFGLLFGVIGVGVIIMTCLFFYWLKYVYVEKDEKDDRRQYTPLSQNYNEINNTNKKEYYKVDPDFIKNANKRKNKKL